MKKIYNSPNLNIVHLENADIVTVSAKDESTDANKPQWGRERGNAIWGEDE
jgi:hypothetical protein